MSKYQIIENLSHDNAALKRICADNDKLIKQLRQVNSKLLHRIKTSASAVNSDNNHDEDNNNNTVVNDDNTNNNILNNNQNNSTNNNNNAYTVECVNTMLKQVHDHYNNKVEEYENRIILLEKSK